MIGKRRVPAADANSLLIYLLQTNPKARIGPDSRVQGPQVHENGKPFSPLVWYIRLDPKPMVGLDTDLRLILKPIGKIECK